MKKIFEYLRNKKIAISVMAMSLFVLPLQSFASEGSVTVDTSALTTALTSIATNIKEVVTSVAPIALGVTAVFLIWKYGVKFFKGLLN